MTATIDGECCFVPADVTNEELREALATTDPEVNRLAHAIRFEETSEVVGRLLRWFMNDATNSLLARDILGSTFGLSQRLGLTETDLAARHHLSVQTFKNEKRRLLKLLGLRVVHAADAVAS